MEQTNTTENMKLQEYFENNEFHEYRVENIQIPTKKYALRIMKDIGLGYNIIKHELAVMRKARDLAHNITKVNVDHQLVKIGALMHDIGRIKTHSFLHAPIGADILRRMGFSEKLARIAERHTMAGLTLGEAKRFNLPARNYVPESIEEKIVCLADKYHAGTRKVTIQDRFQKWINKYGETEFLMNQLDRAQKLEEEVLKLIF